MGEGRSLKPLEAVRHGLEQMRPQFQATLPSHISVAKFERVVMTAANTDPDLVNADRRSLFNACVRAAQDGLLPDKREGALVIFKDKTGQKLVQWMPMVFGLIKKIRQSGEIDSIGARIVYQKEIDDGRFKFIVEDGQEKLFHDPMLWGDRGQKVLVYAYARFKESGYVEYAPLHRDDVQKRRAVSRSTAGPWQSWEDEMWLKTAIRAIAKRLPLSADIMTSIERDEEPTQFDRMRTAAFAQLGAPPPAQDDDPSHEVGAQDGMDALAMTTVTVNNAIEYLKTTDELRTTNDFNEFVGHIRDVVANAEIDDDQRLGLLGPLNAAHLERVRKAK